MTPPDLITRFAARWGADGAMMQNAPEPVMEFSITGGCGRNQSAYAGEIEAIWLNFHTRWGNYVYQLIHVFHAATLLQVKQVHIVSTDIFPVSERHIGGIKILSHAQAPPANLYCLRGVFFDPLALGRMMDSLTAARRVQLAASYVAPLLAPMNTSQVPLGPDDLAIHIRSGDIFEGEDGAAAAIPGGIYYIQPPLSFYAMVLERVFVSGKGRIVIIAENAMNPVILPLVRQADKMGLAVTLRLGQSLADDLCWLLAARQIVFANGTIGIALALLSKSLRAGYFFRRNSTGMLHDISYYLGCKIEQHVVSDRDGAYIQIGDWSNTQAQRAEMLECPQERLFWENP